MYMTFEHTKGTKGGTNSENRESEGGCCIAFASGVFFSVESANGKKNIN